MQRFNLRPSKPASIGGLIVLGFLILFGLGFAALVGSVLVSNDAPPLAIALFALFMLGWIGTAVFMLVYHAANLTRPKGLPFMNLDSDAAAPDAPQDPAQRLRDLEKLKMDGLVTEEEYKRKREEILSQKW